VRTYARLPAAGLGFFVSAWLLMLFTGYLHHDLGVHAIGYLDSMVATIGLWLVMVPAISAVAPRGPWITGHRTRHGRG